MAGIRYVWLGESLGGRRKQIRAPEDSPNAAWLEPAFRNYADYLLPAILILSNMLGATTAVAVATDLTSGMVDRLRSLPIARSAVLAGRTPADLGRSVIVVAVVLAVGMLVGFRFHNGFVPGAAGLGLVLVFSFAMSWQMVWVGMKVRDPETAEVAGFAPLVPLIFASSGFVPVRTMPGWLQGFAHVQPFGVIINAVRALTQGGPVFHWLWQAASLDARDFRCLRDARRPRVPSDLTDHLEQRTRGPGFAGMMSVVAVIAHDQGSGERCGLLGTGLTPIRSWGDPECPGEGL